MEGLVAEEADRVLWWLAKLYSTARLMFCQVVFVDWVFFARVSGIELGRCVHTTKVLREQVFAVEVVEVDSLVILCVDGWRTKIATPVAELDVLGADVSLPFVLGNECRVASIRSKRTGKLPAFVVCVDSLLDSNGGSPAFLRDLD